jgi:NitT/TauT family transport system substrate-binding protein
MQKKILGILGVCALLVCAGALFLLQPGTVPTGGGIQPEPLSIGMNPAEYAALVFIAQDQGYFTASGLNVSIRPYGSGAAALAGMERSEVDLALCSEFPIVAAAFRGDNVSVIANIDRYQSGFLVSRQDLGVVEATDLDHRRFGVEKGTLGEFRLYRFFSLNRLDPANTTVVQVPMPQSLDALANGSVDAVVVLGSDLTPAERRFGNSLIAWRVDTEQQGYSLLAGRREWVGSNPDELVRLLRALSMAESYAATHPDEAKFIVKKRLNLTDAYTTKIWPDHQFTITLDQSLILAMEYEGRWMAAGNLTSRSRVPNFLEYVNTDAMTAVRPVAVNIIR